VMRRVRTALPNCYRCGRQPCECRDGVTLYHADCRDVLPLLDKESAALVYTDPPYRIAAQFGEVHTRRGYGDGRASGTRKLQFEWDGQVIVDDVREGLSAAFQICQKNRACFVWVGFDSAERYAEPARRSGFTVKPAAWVKACPPPAGHGNWWPSGFELAYYGYRTGAWFGDTNVKRCNVWKADSYRHGKPGKLDHPTQKPIGLVSGHVESLCPPGAMILDPFAGSSTTGRVAKDLGRKCIMVEIEEKYCKIAANRLHQEVLF